MEREITTIDLKGRVTIPKFMREEIGLIEGGKVIVELDIKRRVILIKPLDIRDVLVKIISEKSSISDVIRDLREFTPDLDLIDLRCRKDLNDYYQCIILATVKKDKSDKIIEKLSTNYIVERIN
ncbi:MAG: hypothetical protein ABWJ42_02485 [Sulfolobales archaeon]